jgi:type II secretory pathway component HofQ
MTHAALIFLVLGTTASPSPRQARLSLDLKDAPIADIVRALAEVGGLQVVVDPGIQCSLTLRLKEVPMETALDAVLRACSLSREEQNGILRVATVARLVDEGREERRLAEEKAADRPKSLTLIPLSYARAEELAPLLKKLLGPRGDVVFDRRTNTLLIMD